MNGNAQVTQKCYLGTLSYPPIYGNYKLYADGNSIFNGTVRVMDNDILLREGMDFNHGLGWYGDGKLFDSTKIDGPVLYGFAGGSLATNRGGEQQNVLRWFNDGKVSIGDVPSMPGDYSLYVQKGILTEHVRITVKTSSDWSDFVFDENYKLPSLKYVADFIRKNKHLPDVPSAKDVVKDGVDVATMQANLLQKIEELTLYVLQQQKEIENLKARQQAR